jgi:hypothetical protein
MRHALSSGATLTRGRSMGTPNKRSAAMTICPIAIAVGCKKCPAFSVCPLKSVIGDQKPDDAKAAKPDAAAKAGKKP